MSDHAIVDSAVPRYKAGENPVIAWADQIWRGATSHWEVQEMLAAFGNDAIDYALRQMPKDTQL